MEFKEGEYDLSKYTSYSKFIGTKNTIFLIKKKIIFSNKESLYFKNVDFKIFPLNPDATIYIKNVKNITFENCRFDGQSISIFKYTLFNIENFDSLTFLDTKFENFCILYNYKTTDFIHINNGKKVVFDRVIFNDNILFGGIYLHKIDKTIISNSVIKNTFCSIGVFRKDDKSQIIIKNSLFYNIKLPSIFYSSLIKKMEKNSFRAYSFLSTDVDNFIVKNCVFYNIYLKLFNFLHEKRMKPIKLKNCFFWNIMYVSLSKAKIENCYIQPQVLRESKDFYPYPLKIKNYDALEKDEVIKKFIKGEKLTDNDVLKSPIIWDLRGKTPKECGKILEKLNELQKSNEIFFYRVLLPEGTIKTTLCIYKGFLELIGIKDKTILIPSKKNAVKLAPYGIKESILFWANTISYVKGKYYHLEYSFKNFFIFSNVKVKDITFEGLHRIGYLKGDCVFENCKFSHSWIGVSISNGNIIFDNCIFEHIGKRCLEMLYLKPPRNVIIKNCIFRYNIGINEVLEFSKEINCFPAGKKEGFLIGDNSLSLSTGNLKIVNTLFYDNYLYDVAKFEDEKYKKCVKYLEENKNYILLLKIADYDCVTHLLKVNKNYDKFAGSLKIENCLFYNNKFNNDSYKDAHNDTVCIGGTISINEDVVSSYVGREDRIFMKITVLNTIFYKNAHKKGNYIDLSPFLMRFINVSNCSFTNSIALCKNCIISSPMWKSEKDRDFHLKSDSPLIDKGKNVKDLEKDIEGNPRIIDGNKDGKAIIDIGPYEYIPQ